MSTTATSTQSMPAAAQLLQMTMGKWVSTAIAAAAELGIADLLVSGER
jgi:hypothetical protein